MFNVNPLCTSTCYVFSEGIHYSARNFGTVTQDVFSRRQFSRILYIKKYKVRYMYTVRTGTEQ
jgi:hypothetical protein